SFHSIVRGSGGSNKLRPIVLSTLTASSSQKRLNELDKTIAKLDDKRIIATVHYYGFYPFSVNLGGVTTFNEEARNDLVQTFDRVHETFVAKGIPVIIGEFGLLGFDKSVDTIEQGEKLKYFEYLGYYAKQKQLTTMLWDNGQHFDRRALEWKDPELFAVMKASAGGRSSTASTDQLF
ncbi:glycoside hydrolase family 5 protein, partial [Paenibacillus sp. MCAF20]